LGVNIRRESRPSNARFSKQLGKAGQVTFERSLVEVAFLGVAQTGKPEELDMDIVEIPCSLERSPPQPTQSGVGFGIISLFYIPPGRFRTKVYAEYKRYSRNKCRA
jgi:hypothetical protein